MFFFIRCDFTLFGKLEIHQPANKCHTKKSKNVVVNHHCDDLRCSVREIIHLKNRLV